MNNMAQYTYSLDKFCQHIQTYRYNWNHLVGSYMKLHWDKDRMYTCCWLEDKHCNSFNYFIALCRQTLFAHSGVQYIVHCVFVLFVFVLCFVYLCGQFFWIIHFTLPILYSPTFIYEIVRKRKFWTVMINSVNINSLNIVNFVLKNIQVQFLLSFFFLFLNSYVF